MLLVGTYLIVAWPLVAVGGLKPEPISDSVPRSTALGIFPHFASMTASYRLGWSGITAARVTVHLRRGRMIDVKATGRSVGLARTLYRVDFDYRARLRASDLGLISASLRENYRKVSVQNTLRPEQNGVAACRYALGEEEKKKERLYNIGGITDLFGGLLRLRSRPLQDGDIETALVCHGDRLYVASVEVLGRTERDFAVGRFPTIMLDLKLTKVSKKGHIEEHAKFRRAVAYLSDDEQRNLLLIESELFFGSIFAELVDSRPPED